MKNHNTMKVVFKVDSLLNPQNSRDNCSYISCEDRCNKLDINRKKTRHSGR